MDAKRDMVNKYKERYGKQIQREIKQMDAKIDMVNKYKERYGRWMQGEIW